MPIDLVVAGAAAKTTVSGSMTVAAPGGGGTFTVASAAGYPVSGKYAVVIERGLATEEKILINSRSGTTFTVGQRGYDGTSAADHPTNATCELSLPATVVQTLIDHENGTQASPHSGILLNNAAHDITGRHQFGLALGTPGTPTALTPDIAGAAGSGTVPARSDHTHNVPAGTASTITGSNAEGAGASFARLDHNHAVGGTNHIPGAALVNKSVAAAQITDGIIANGTLLATGQQLPYVTGTNPGAVGAGAMWFNTTKRALLVRNAGNTDWEVVNSWGASIAYTPTLTNFTVGAGTNEARYRRHGSSIIVDGFIQFGAGATTNANLFALSLPVAAADYSATMGSFYYHGAARGTDTPNANWAGVGLVLSGDSPGAPFDRQKITAFATAGQIGWNNTSPFTWDGSAGDSFSWFVEYEPATYNDANYV